MKNFLICIAFVSSCGPLKMDTAQAKPWLTGPSMVSLPQDSEEAQEARGEAYDMVLQGDSCETVQNYLLDTSLDNLWVVDCENDKPVDFYWCDDCD